jgi:hypothetical protein
MLLSRELKSIQIIGRYILTKVIYITEEYNRKYAMLEFLLDFDLLTRKLALAVKKRYGESI